MEILSKQGCFLGTSRTEAAERYRTSKRGREFDVHRALASWIDNHFFGNALKIKLPSQSGLATPLRYAFNDSTEEFTRRLL
jgi:hypothetical protein